MEELNLNDVDTLSIEIKDENLMLRPVNVEFEEWAEAYRQANIDYKEVLNELAK